jgi:predicted esterase
VPDGGSLTDTLSAGDLHGPPAEVRQLPAFELDPAPENGHVCALGCLVCPPTTGDYTFAIAGDDTALLLLSPDEHPTRRKPIASVPSYTAPRDFKNFAAQTSHPVHLFAGHRYWAEAWLQNAAGGSHVSVAWTLPDGTIEAPIPANRLVPAPADLRPPPYTAGPATATLAADPLPANQPGFHPLPHGAHCVVAGEPVDVSYALYLPEQFDHTHDPRPLLVFLHGNGHQGSDLAGEMNEGPPAYLSQDPKLRAAFPMIGLFPQLPDGWRWDSPGAAQIVNAIVRRVRDRYPRADRRRTYITGLSMGGKGTWLTALDDPTLYANITTFSAVAVHPTTAGARLAGVPHLHIICGGDDGDFAAGSQAMYAAIKPALGDRVELTVVPHEGHGVWGRYYPDPAFYKDLMAYHR